MIAVIRIKGKINISEGVRETMKRLNLNSKYSCLVLSDTKENRGKIGKIRDFVAYGEIDDKILERLIKERGEKVDKTKEIDTKKALEGIKKGEKYEEFNLKKTFRLHPPRRGIDSKLHFGKAKGVLGDNGKDINKLIERML